MYNQPISHGRSPKSVVSAAVGLAVGMMIAFTVNAAFAQSPPAQPTLGPGGSQAPGRGQSRRSRRQRVGGEQERHLEGTAARPIHAHGRGPDLQGQNSLSSDHSPNIEIMAWGTPAATVSGSSNSVQLRPPFRSRNAGRAWISSAPRVTKGRRRLWW